MILRITFAGLLLLMLGQPMNALASSKLRTDCPRTGSRLVADPVDVGVRQMEPVSRLLAVDHKVRGLPGF